MFAKITSVFRPRNSPLTRYFNNINHNSNHNYNKIDEQIKNNAHINDRVDRLEVSSMLNCVLVGGIIGYLYTHDKK